jgi:ferredoxin
LSRNRSREPEIPAEAGKYAKEAVKRCPRLALRLID